MQTVSTEVACARQAVLEQLHTLNELRLARGACIRQDPELKELCESVCAGFLRLKDLDPSRASEYDRAADVLKTFPAVESPKKVRPATY